MSAFTAWQSQDRSSRQVRRTRLRVPPEAPRQRLVSMLEESLRLAELPGEAEGRCYYFRRVHVAGLPVNGDRAVWLDRFQRVLNDQASSAVYAGAPGAAAAGAVYFASHREACEVLLRRIVTGKGATEWFWPSVLAPDAAPARRQPGASPGRADLPMIVERLRQMPASWVAVAETVFAALGDASPIYFLQSFPMSMMEAWLQEIGGWRPAQAEVRAAPLPGRTRSAVAAAIAAFGAADARAEWLTTLAVLLECPRDLQSKTAVARARVALREMAAQERPLQWTTPKAAGEIRAHEPASPDSIFTTPPDSPLPAPHTIDDEAALAPGIETHPARVDATTTQPRALPAESATPPEIRKSPTPRIPLKGLPLDIGTPTTAGGLFFFLNVLGRLGIAEAMEDELAVRVLLRLAAAAGVDPEDSVVAWLEASVARTSGPRSTGQRPAPLARAWAVAARRWCWRAGRLTAHAIVQRQAIWSVNRTDLDVTLPLDSADIATRRLGLDLDPGWLPWFGRVVRFHYRDRGAAHV